RSRRGCYRRRPRGPCSRGPRCPTSPGQVVVRLCEVAGDGRSRRLSWGARNLALSDDLSAPRRAGATSRRVIVDVALFSIAETLAAGNRLRIALSTSY